MKVTPRSGWTYPDRASQSCCRKQRLTAQAALSREVVPRVQGRGGDVGAGAADRRLRAAGRGDGGDVGGGRSILLQQVDGQKDAGQQADHQTENTGKN